MARSDILDIVYRGEHYHRGIAHLLLRRHLSPAPLVCPGALARYVDVELRSGVVDKADF